MDPLYIKSSRGMNMLSYGGFLFYKHYTRNEKTYWKCKRMPECPSRAITLEPPLTMLQNTEHNHAPNPDEVLCGMSPPGSSNSDLEMTVAVADRSGPEGLGQEGRLYLEMSDLSEKLQLQNKLIACLEGEKRLLQVQLATKENEVSAVTREKDQLRNQLTEARQRIQYLEDLKNAQGGVCEMENCLHMKLLSSLNLQSKTEGISTEVKELERLAHDLQQKLGNVLGSLSALGSSLAILPDHPKQVVEENCILGLSDGEVERRCSEPLDVKTESQATAPVPSSCHVSGANQDASSSSSTDVRDSLEVILQSVPQNEQTVSTHLPPLSDHEDAQVTARQSIVELKCIICKQNFKFPEEEVGDSVEQGAAFKCAVCKKQELRRSSKTSDTSPAKSNKIFKCTICSKVFHFPSKLKNHLRTHTGEKPFHCNVCGKSFSLSFNLKIHYRTHSGERPFACEVCGKNFRQSKSLLYHNCLHNVRKSPVTCRVCKKSFEPGTFKGHACIQPEGKPSHYTCEVCGKNFACSSTFIAHAMTHAEKQACSCNSCGEAFSQLADLKKHWCAGNSKRAETQSNSGVVSLYSQLCVVCGESFSDSTQLLKHQLIHQTEGSLSPTFASNHGPKHFSVLSSLVDSSGSSPLDLGKKQAADVFSSKNLNDRLLTTERSRDGKRDGSPHHQPEFYDISELAMLKSYSDSSTL